MKVVRNLGCGVLLLGLTVLGMFLWWCRVPVGDPVTIASVRTSVEDLVARQAAIPDKENGFEDLRDLWGLEDDPKDAKMVEAIHALPQLRTTGTLDYGRLLAAKPKEAGMAVQAFEGLYPRIKAAIEKPHFVYPIKVKLDLTAIQAGKTFQPDWIAFRCIGESLGMTSSWYARQGQLGKAVERSLLGLELAGRLSGQELIGEMIAISIVDFNAQPLLQILASGKLGPTECRKVVVALEKLPIKSKDFATATDLEYVRSEDLADTLGTGMPMSLPIVGPAYIRREKNMVANLYLQTRRGLLELKPPPTPSLSQWDFVVGIATMGYQNYHAVNSLKVALLRLQAIRALAELELLYSEKHAYPDTYEMKDSVPGSTWSYASVGQKFRLTCEAADLTTTHYPGFKDGRWEVKPLEALRE